MAVAVVVPLLGTWWVLTGGAWMGSDLDAYRAGSQHLHDGLLYGARAGLPFTYPPFAAALLAPLAVLGEPAAQVVWLVATWACYVAFVVVVFQRLLGSARVPVGWVLAGLAFEPVWHTVALGQLNLLLALVVALDVLVVPARWRGLGVGIAAGLKLTPAVFVVYFLVRREWASALRAGVGLALTIGVGALVDATDTWDYWTHLSSSPDHVGGVPYVTNQSVYAVLTRALHTEHPPPALYVVLAAAALGLAALAAWRRSRAGDDVAALVCVAVGGLLVSPVSWSHHWVWLLPAAGVLLVRRRWVAGALVVLAAVVSPMRFVPKGNGVELHLAWWQQGVCATYVLVGVLFLLLMLRDDADSA